MKSFFLRQLEESDKFILSKLRRDLIAAEFSEVEDRTLLNWGPSDRRNLVYGIFAGDQLISTIRMDKLDSIFLFEQGLEITFQEYPCELPVALVGRSATLKEYQNQGFHSFLRLICLMKAIQAGYSLCFSTVKSNSFRKSSFRKMGYELIPGSTNWKGFLKDEVSPLIARLNLKEQGDRAVVYLSTKTIELRKQVELSPDLKSAIAELDARFPLSV